MSYDPPVFFTDPFWLVAFALLPPLIVLGLWEGKTVRARRSALGLGRAGGDRWRPRASTAIRALIISCVLLALAGLQLVQASGPLTVVYLVDVSDSVTPDQRSAALAYIRQGMNAMQPEDSAGVVLFAERAVVERLPGPGRDLESFSAAPPAGGTNLAEAMRLGLALLPAEGRRRLVLISDGGETAGEARQQARLLGAAGAQLFVVPYAAGAQNEVSVETVAAPSSVPLGQSFRLRILVQSTVEQGARLRIFEDGVLLHERDVLLRQGENLFEHPVEPAEQGFHSYRAGVLALDDRWQANNESSGFTVVQSEPRVLVVARAEADGEPLRVALESARVRADVSDPFGMPGTLEGLMAYDSVVLANVPAEDIPLDTQKLLQLYVRDLGRGLLMIGGEHSFGAGGYFGSPVEEALPVSMDVRASSREADLALALVVDKSGSMGRCHCGSSAVFRSTDAREEGVAKVDIAKDAIVKAAGTMAPADRIGVVAFDNLARWVVRLQPVSQVQDLSGQVAGIAAEGDTNIFSGLQAAVDSLRESDARLKHIILLTDGWSMTGSYDELIGEMRRQNITLSTIGAGGGSAELLQRLAQTGGGRFYHAADVNSVPQLFFKETMLASGSYLIEEATAPVRLRGSPILEGLDGAPLPNLLGYNNTTAKQTAETILASPEGDPLLAQWQYGLGRAVAWTSDAKGRWATDWVLWPRFSQFASQLVGWTLPREDSPGLQLQVSTLPGGSRITVESTAPNGAPRDFLQTTLRVVAPDLSATEIDLPQVGAGRYEGRVETAEPGAYSMQLTQVDQNGRLVAEQRTGLVVPYAPEYRLLRPPDAAPALLAELASATGGRQLDLASPAEAFAPGGTALPARLPAWPWLLLLAALLFPLDVAVRRLTMTRGDVARFFRAVRTGEFLQRQPRAEPPRAGSPVPPPRAGSPVPPPRITEVHPGGKRESFQADAGREAPPPEPAFGLGRARPRDDREAMWPTTDYDSSMRKLREQRERARRHEGEH